MSVSNFAELQHGTFKSIINQNLLAKIMHQGRENRCSMAHKSCLMFSDKGK